MRTLTDCEAFYARARIDARRAWIDAHHRKRNGWASWRDEELPWRFRDAAENWNELSSAVEAYEVRRNPPQRLVAYVGRLEPVPGFPYEKLRPLTTWTGQKLGTCRITSRWRIRSFISSHMCQIYATINGATYTGRGHGEGMAVVLKRRKGT